MRTHRLIILTILIGCKVAAPNSSSTDIYSEDLSALRPTSSEQIVESDSVEKFQTEQYVALTGHIKNELDSIAKINYQINKKGKFVDGFVIQVYSGNSREEANTVRNQMYQNFSELRPKVSYHQPTFRVKAGQFTDRLEANRVYEAVKKEFPGALLTPERFSEVYE
jgi:hypothetical protein